MGFPLFSLFMVNILTVWEYLKALFIIFNNRTQVSISDKNNYFLIQIQLYKFAIRKSFLKSICRLNECVGLEYPLYYWDKVLSHLYKDGDTPSE